MNTGWLLSKNVGESDPVLSNRATAAIMTGIAALTFTLRYLLISMPDRVIDFDGTYYVAFASQIINGGGLYHPIFAPGYPLLIALFHHLFGTGMETAGEYVSLIFSLLCLYPLYQIANRCTSRPAALLTLLFYASLPLWVEYGAGVQTMTLATFFWLMAFECCMRWQDQEKTAYLLLVGILLGIAALTRPEFLVSAMILPAWLFFQSWQKTGRKTWLVWLILPLTMAVYSPYISAIHQATGTWKIATKSEINQRIAASVGAKDYSTAREQTARAATAAGASQSLLHFWFSDPLQTAKRMLANIYLFHEYMWPKQIPVALTLFMAIGIFAGIGQTRMDILWVSTLIYLPALTFLPDARILLPWATLFLPWAGYGLLLIYRHFGKAAWLILIATMGLLILSSLQATRHEHPAVAIKHAALWLAKHHNGETVWARGPRVPYYSHADVKQPPASANMDAFRQHVSGPGWLIIDNQKFPLGRQPLYGELIGNTPAWLSLERNFFGPGGHVVSVFRVLPEKQTSTGLIP